jgi:hypothetical protein
LIGGLTLLSRLADGVGRFSSLCEMGNKKAVDQKSTACNASYSIRLVPRRGLEPPRLSALVPETSASTNSAIWASQEASNYRASSSSLRARLEEKCKSFAITGIGRNKKADDTCVHRLIKIGVCLRWCPEEDSNLHDVTR